jgi:phosphoenolpyruvate synthase/pyruvate phosphate dikinase
MIIPFSEIKEDQQFVGSKAYVLAILFSKGLPVPNGLILSHKPDNDEDWNRVRSWWTSIGMPLLAVRSSAFGEDSKEMSFAGQNQSFFKCEKF